MRIDQYHWDGEDWIAQEERVQPSSAQLTLIFGDRDALDAPGSYSRYASAFNDGQVIVCSTAGHFIGDEVHSAPMVATTISFDHTRIEVTAYDMNDEDSSAVGKRIAEDILSRSEAPKLVYILSDGGLVNGSDLLEGITQRIPEGPVVAGGLAGDGSRFERTLVGLNGTPVPGRIVVTLFYGDQLEVSTGSAAGWEPFGPSRTITSADKNVLTELDDKTALDLYKRYLGPRADELPSAALLFPLELIDEKSGRAVIRTILSIDNDKGSMTFAGNVPVGSNARFMCAHFDKLINSAASAAQQAAGHADDGQGLALVMSCVGRRLVLGQRTDEELSETMLNIGPRTAMTGFYSYGEMGPGIAHGPAQFHNQTITITRIHEKPL